MFPFIISGIVILHLLFLHEFKSSNPIGVNTHYSDKIYLSPYFIIKDILGLVYFLIIYFFMVFYFPNYLGHTDNYIEADPLVTPAHIVPEWYFLIFYAMLRAIPNKLGGVIVMVTAILILFILPIYLPSKIRSMQFRPLSRFLF